jgi:hypothetical protein
LGDDADTDSWGTMIAALPPDGQARVGRGIVIVVEVPETLVVVVMPGLVVVVNGNVVDVVDVVPEVAVAGLAPTMRPTATAATPRSEMTTRHNFEASV